MNGLKRGMNDQAMEGGRGIEEEKGGHLADSEAPRRVIARFMASTACTVFMQVGNGAGQFADDGSDVIFLQHSFFLEERSQLAVTTKLHDEEHPGGRLEHLLQVDDVLVGNALQDRHLSL